MTEYFFLININKDDNIYSKVSCLKKSKETPKKKETIKERKSKDGQTNK